MNFSNAFDEEMSRFWQYWKIHHYNIYMLWKEQLYYSTKLLLLLVLLYSFNNFLIVICCIYKNSNMICKTSYINSILFCLQYKLPWTWYLKYIMTCKSLLNNIVVVACAYHDINDTLKYSCLTLGEMTNFSKLNLFFLQQ